MQQLPLDFIVSLDMPDWRKDFRWMLTDNDIERLYDGQNGRLREFLENPDIDAMQRRALLLALPAIRYQFNNSLFDALSLQAAVAKGFDLASSLPEVNFLKTGDIKLLPNSATVDPLRKNPKWLLLRRIARTLTWTQWWRLPLVLLKPQVIALGHNEMLRSQAAASDLRIHFYQPEHIVATARNAYLAAPKSEPNDDAWCSRIFELFVNSNLFEAVYLERLQQLFNRLIKPLLLRCYADLAALDGYAQLPSAVWVANAKPYASRAVALAVLQRGGKVSSFSHASGSALVPNFDSFLLADLAVTGEYVAITPAAAKALDKHYSQELRSNYHNFKISCADGNPKFKEYARKLAGATSRPKHKRPTVVYTSTIIGWTRSYVCASNTVYLDWQLRLVEILKTLDIDLICQPHPEGIFINKNLTHPLRKELNIPYRRFEEIIEQADIFLVDYIHSTTFGEMLVTDKPIVRIAMHDDSLFNGMREDLRPLLDARCRTVGITCGEDNLPYIDKATLQHALLDNWQEKVDPSYFRELLLGGTGD